MSDHSITPAESPDEQTLLYAESLARLIRAETVSGPGTSGDLKFHAFPVAPEKHPLSLLLSRLAVHPAEPVAHRRIERFGRLKGRLTVAVRPLRCIARASIPRM